MHSLLFSLCLLIATVHESNQCVSYFCVNSCGSSIGQPYSGYKLILANNRDENYRRLTIDSDYWPHGRNEFFAYGPLDLQNGRPPYYSTWIGMNSYGNIANLLFYKMDNKPRLNRPPRGNVVPNYVLNNSLKYNANAYLTDLDEIKYDYGGFSLVVLEMSPKTGGYSIYYTNNNKSKPYEQLNKEDSQSFSFAVSNSDPAEPFNKVVVGKERFSDAIKTYSATKEKQKLINSMMNELLLDSRPNYPDENLSKYFKIPQTGATLDALKKLSAIKADYTTIWPSARTRTSTLILVDYNDSVEYFEFNLTMTQNSGGLTESWKAKNESFKLKPFYNNSGSNGLNTVLCLISFIVIVMR